MDLPNLGDAGKLSTDVTADTAPSLYTLSNTRLAGEGDGSDGR